MTKEHIKQDLAHLLETITEQVESIYEHEKKIPQIELDIVMSNVRSLYDQLIALNKINSKTEMLVQSEIQKETSEEKKTEPGQKEVVQEKIEIVAASKAEEKPLAPEPIAKIAEEPKPEIKQKQEQKINVQEEVVVKAIVQEEKQSAKKITKSAASLFDAAPSLGEQFDDGQTLKEKISSSKTEKSVVDKIHHQKIDDLKKAIGINEKFLFINELFEGSLASYNEHIEKINISAGLSHAQSIIDSLIAKYNWDAEQEIVKKFMDLVERRFI